MGYANIAIREGEMINCILNEGALKYDKQTDSYSPQSQIKVDDFVELDTKRDNTYDLYNIPFVRKCKQSSTFGMGVVISVPLWQALPREPKSIQDWAELRKNYYYRYAIVYLLRPIAVVNNRYLLTSQILIEYKNRKQSKKQETKEK